MMGGTSWKTCAPIKALENTQNCPPCLPHPPCMNLVPPLSLLAPCHLSRSSNIPQPQHSLDSKYEPNPVKQLNKHFVNNMSRATVELDFFGMDQHRDTSPSKSQFQKFLHRQRSFRGVQNAMSKIKPDVLKSVIASGSPMASRKAFSVPSSPKAERTPFPSCLPVYIPTGTSVSSFMPTAGTASESLQETMPLTIFYNGTVSVFDVPRDKGESILKLALEGNSTKAAESALALDPKLVLHSSEQQQLLDPLNGDLPIARRKSLERFLEKRKDRLNLGSPYACRA